MDQSLIQKIKNPFQSTLFLLSKLPMAWIAGLKVEAFDDQHSIVSVPFRYLTQNPFRSIYFACLAMAGELSTGLLLLLYVQRAKTPIPTLVVDFKSTFIKKATEKIYFTCNDGESVRVLVEQAIVTKEPVLIETTSIGKNSAGEEVCIITVNWSIKVKK